MILMIINDKIEISDFAYYNLFCVDELTRIIIMKKH